MNAAGVSRHGQVNQVACHTVRAANEPLSIQHNQAVCIHAQFTAWPVQAQQQCKGLL